MLSKDPLLTVCILLQDQNKATLSAVAAALNSCPSQPHEVLLVSDYADIDDPSHSAGCGQAAGLRSIPIDLQSYKRGLWDIVTKEPKGFVTTVMMKPGILSADLPEKAMALLQMRPGALVVPKQTLEGLDESWEYGCELTPDLSMTGVFNSSEEIREIPAARMSCFTFSQQKLNEWVALSGGTWLSCLIPQELSLRWWLMGGEIVCQTTTHFIEAHGSAHSLPNTMRWLRDRLRTAILHLSQARLDRLCTYYSRLYPAEYSLIIDETERQTEWQWRNELAERRLRSDDWFFSRFGIEVMPAPLQLTAAQ